MRGAGMGANTRALDEGPIRSARARFEKVSEGYIPKAGEPSKRWLRHATIHVKQKRGILGVTVNIIPPDAKFPDKISLKGLPEIEYPEEEVFMPEGVEPDVEEIPRTEQVTPSSEQPTTAVEVVEMPTEVAPTTVEEPAPAQTEPETPLAEEAVETPPAEEKVETLIVDETVEEEAKPEEKPEEGKEEN